MKRKIKEHLCKDCGDSITSEATYCGSCARKGKRNPHYKEGYCLKQHFCVDCGKEITCQATRCKVCANLGENNPSYGKYGKESAHWKGGYFDNPYPSGWQKITEQIRKRDDYTCQLCGIPELECERKLHVHHKDYNKNNINSSNLISLCISCHTKTNYNRDYWLKYFGVL